MPRIEANLKIQNHIQKYRQMRNLTQEELAKEINVTRATIIALEKGNYNPSLELAFRLTHFFNIEINQLFYL